MKNGVVIALFALLIFIFSILGYAIFVQLSSGEYGDEAAKFLCLAVILIPAFLGFELLFKRHYYIRRGPEPESEED
ncbi:MAG: hypothetical protein ACE5IO_00095 [Thermoplasmata archaeon]